MFMRTLLVSAATLTLAACSSVDLSEPDPMTDDGMPRICNAARASHIEGQRLTPMLEQQALQSSGAGMLRVIRPDQVITEEYRSQRLNLQLNDFGVVVRAYCG